ncbi:acyl-CoA dehydrogenase [Ruegeria sp. 2012CJ41-6]|uniref:Acyl-CoA dehydrogenase n=1 Tax=Ruegeria spongiae TaxID=2942209 RepID=A0ABT0PZ05_9RHOB|nr:acyl-CoA dehydrogenase [Ruegeria spongiae]MCL6282407.1 acyl-CoA dehydrogenase [Ruegeria spongiae]
MDFELNEDQVMLRDMLRRFLNDRYSHEARRTVLASGQSYDTGLFSDLAELGILGAVFAPEQGGYGGTGTDMMVVFQELGRAGVIEPVLGSAVLAGGLLAALDADGHSALLQQTIAGETILALAHSEPQSRYDLGHVTTRASAANGQFVLNGAKVHVLNGAQADMLLVSAREEGGPTDEHGISLFLVPSTTAGVSCTGHLNVDGTSSARITLDAVTVDQSQRLGQPGQAHAALEAAHARATLALCAEALGAMEVAKALTVAYLQERKQFGVPIGSFQALQHRLAGMLIEIEQARSAVINLAGHLEADRLTRECHVSATKNLIGRVGALVAEECIQMHGGIGMTDEYALSHYARRLVMIDHIFGDVDHHLDRFIAFSGGSETTGENANAG